MNINILLPIVPATTQPLELPVRVNITNASASPSSNTILPTVRENMKYREPPAAATTTAVPFVPNVPSHLKTVPMAVPDTTPVTVVLPASPIPTVTFPTSPVPMAVRLTTAVRSARPVKTIRIAVRRRFPVTTDVPQPTPAVSVPLVRAIRIVTCPINPAITVVRRPIPAASALPANLVHRRQTRPAVPTGRNLVPTVAAVPDCVVKGIPILTLVRVGTAAQTLGEVRLRLPPRPVLAVLLREPVTKPRHIPTVTVVPAGTSLQVVRLLKFRPGQLLRFALAALLPAPVIPAVPRPALMAATILQP